MKSWRLMTDLRYFPLLDHFPDLSSLEWFVFPHLRWETQEQEYESETEQELLQESGQAENEDIQFKLIYPLTSVATSLSDSSALAGSAVRWSASWLIWEFISFRPFSSTLVTSPSIDWILS